MSSSSCDLHHTATDAGEDGVSEICTPSVSSTSRASARLLYKRHRCNDERDIIYLDVIDTAQLGTSGYWRPRKWVGLIRLFTHEYVAACAVLGLVNASTPLCAITTKPDHSSLESPVTRLVAVSSEYVLCDNS
jgi:hypothetical protein